MFKFAFILNVPTASPENYSAVCETAQSRNTVVGVDGMEAAVACMKKMIADGAQMLDFCGDFDNDMTQRLRRIAGEGIKICHASYTPEELEKLNALDSMKNYGIIIKTEGVDGMEEAVIENSECRTDVFFVNDVEGAEKAAQQLVKNGIDFIELCSWFDAPKLKSVIESIDGSVPVGSCAEPL